MMPIEQPNWVLHSRLWELYRKITYKGVPGKWLAPTVISGAHIWYWDEVGTAVLAMEQYVLAHADDIEHSDDTPSDVGEFSSLRGALNLLRKLPERPPGGKIK
jgi:hypothetical protein